MLETIYLTVSAIVAILGAAAMVGHARFYWPLASSSRTARSFFLLFSTTALVYAGGAVFCLALIHGFPVFAEKVGWPVWLMAGTLNVAAMASVFSLYRGA